MENTLDRSQKADKRILAKSGMECWSAHWPICLLVLTADLALNFQTKREAISGLCLWVKKHKTKQNETDSCLEVQMFVAMRSWHSFSHGCLWWALYNSENLYHAILGNFLEQFHKISCPQFSLFHLCRISSMFNLQTDYSNILSLSCFPSRYHFAVFSERLGQIYNPVFFYISGQMEYQGSF